MAQLIPCLIRLLPLGGLIPLWMMHLGEVVFGGVGSGLYGMLMVVIITVFVAGLMVGRTPEYLGKKIEPYEMKMAAIGCISHAACRLIFYSVLLLSRQWESTPSLIQVHMDLLKFLCLYLYGKQ